MRAAYKITFEYEYEPGIFKTTTQEYHVKVVDTNVPRLGCFDLERAMKETFSKHFMNMKYIRGDFHKFKTSKACRKVASYRNVHTINRRRNYVCGLCGRFRTHINEFDTETGLGFCPCCHRLLHIEERTIDE